MFSWSQCDWSYWIIKENMAHGVKTSEQEEVYERASLKQNDRKNKNANDGNWYKWVKHFFGRKSPGLNQTSQFNILQEMDLKIMIRKGLKNKSRWRLYPNAYPFWQSKMINKYTQCQKWHNKIILPISGHRFIKLKHGDGSQYRSLHLTWWCSHFALFLKSCY